MTKKDIVKVLMGKFNTAKYFSADNCKRDKEIYNEWLDLHGNESMWIADTKEVEDFKLLIDIYGIEGAYKLREHRFWVVGRGIDEPYQINPTEYLQEELEAIVPDVLAYPHIFDKYVDFEQMWDF